jgi:hypothetical protein
VEDVADDDHLPAVQVPGGEEERLPRGERHDVEVERGERGHVAGVAGHEAADPLPGSVGLAAPPRLAGRALEDRLLLLRVERHEPREERAEGEGRLVAGQASELRRDLRPRDGLQVAGDVADGAESLERGEGRERAHELGLVVGVAVVPVGGVHGDALGVLAFPAAAGLGVVRVGLDRERLRGREHLEEEGQLVPEVIADLLPRIRPGRSG